MIPALESPAMRSQVHTIPVDLYHRLCETGAFDAKTELIEGVVFDKMTVSPDHSFYVQTLYELLLPHRPPGTYVRIQQPLTLAQSEPEPDLAVVEGTAADYRAAHPSGALAVIEVAVSSLEYDREKARVYAGAGIPICWLLNAPQAILEVFSKPGPSGYAVHEVHSLRDSVPLWDGSIDLSPLI